MSEPIAPREDAIVDLATSARCTIVMCPDGGFLLFVDGVMSSAHSNLNEAVTRFGRKCEARFLGPDLDPATPDIRDEPLPAGLPATYRHGHGAPVGDQHKPNGRGLRVPPAEMAKHTATTVLALMTLLAVHPVWRWLV